MKVEIYKLNSDGSQSVIVTCTLEGEKAVCNGDSKTIWYLNQGIDDPETSDLLYPKDGTRFLTILKSHFKNGYLMASEIIP